MLRISLQERLVYRADFRPGYADAIPPHRHPDIPLGRRLLRHGAAHKPQNIAGYTQDNVIAYYFLTMISRAFSSMPGLATGIARDIRDGTIKKYLIQPIDMLGFLLLTRIAHKLVYYGVAAAPFALIFYLFRGYFSGWPDAATMTAFLLSLFMAFLLGFFMECVMGMIGFWFLEISSLAFVFMLLTFFFSGHMFPLDMLPGRWGSVVKLIPLQYLAYFPAAVFLGKVSGAKLIAGLWMQLAWVLAFWAAARLTFRFGVRHYSGFGG